MKEYRSLEEALEDPAQVESLRLDCEELEEIPDSIGALKNLAELQLDDLHEGMRFSAALASLPIRKLIINGQKDGLVPFPAVLLELPLEELSVRHFRVRELFPFADTLRRFRLASYFIFEDMSALFGRLTNLEYLSIWGYHAKNSAGNKKNLEFPETVSNLSRLTEIEIVSTGMKSLPSSFADLPELHTARLRNLSFTEFPEALTRLPKLADLEFSQMRALSSVPDSMARMTSLRTLRLHHSWQSASVMSLSFDDDEPKTEPLPAALGQLANLEHLNLDSCGFASIEPLLGLRNLKSLSFAWAPIKTLAGIEALTKLEELGLRYTKITDLEPLTKLPLRKLGLDDTKVKDLSPLAKIGTLEELNIDGASHLERNPGKALAPLFDHPNLRHVECSEFDDEDAWQKLRSAPRVDADALTKALASEAFGEVLGAIRDITAFSEARSTDDENALIDLFGLDPDLRHEPEPIEFAPLDEALDKWGSEIPADELAALAGATFFSVSDGWKATLVALRLLAKRGDVDAQKKFLEAWFRATNYYDGGHRSWEDSVHDQLIDDVWETFRPEVLADLIVRSPDDELDSGFGDGLDRTFAPALTGLETPHPELLAKLREYAFRNIDDSYGTSPKETLEMIESCAPQAIAEIRTELESIAHDMRVAMKEEEDKKEEARTNPPPPEPMKLLHPPEEEEELTIQERLKAAFEAEGVEAMVEALKRACDEAKSERGRDVAAAFTNNKLIEMLKASRTAEGLSLMHTYADLVEATGLSGGQMRNELAGNTLILVVYSKNEAMERFLFDTLLPNHIAHTGLAYNLSCYFATKGDRARMLELVETAIELGKPKGRFLADTDFEPFWGDAEFLKLVSED